MSVNHETAVDYRRVTQAQIRCGTRKNDAAPVTVDLTHFELSGCSSCESRRFITRIVFDQDLNQSVATVCALCGAVDAIHVIPELPLELPRPRQLGFHDDLGVDPDAPVNAWPAGPVGLAR